MSSSDSKYARISDVTAVTAGNCCDVATNGLLNADELLATSPVVFSVREMIGMKSVISITRVENLPTM